MFKYLEFINELNSRSYSNSLKPGENELEDLTKLCNNSLAYIIDSGFKVEVSNDFTHKDFTIDIVKGSKFNTFYLNSINDDFIAFLEYLSTKYIICYNSINFYQNNWPYGIDVEEIMNREKGELFDSSSDIEKIYKNPLSQISIHVEYLTNSK